MPGGLFQNRIYLRVLTGIGIDSGENRTSVPLAICIKKNPRNENPPSKIHENFKKNPDRKPALGT